ncbi:hypothetical protein HDK90DRAFT_512420 [Phyllosticta capitalensis]|uniref:Uncharacterized protein n=1 Tax=Phyllosticta capitalensis TaxID=121624 RepID=A0ABR1YLK4_9PEZI
MDGRNDLEKGSQPRSNERVDLHADPNGATDESPSVNRQPIDESGQNRNKDSQFSFLNFIATQDGTHELSEMSYKNSSDFSQALNSQDLQHVRFDPTDNCHQILVATVPGHYDFQEDLAERFKTFEPYLECRQAPKESRGFLRRFISREGTEVLIPLDDGQIERNFWTYWRRPSPTKTKALPAAAHYNDLYSIEFATPLSWRRDIFEPNENNYVIDYSLTQQLTRIIKAATNPGEKAEQDLRLAHNRLDVRAEGTLRHFESTFSATIGSMSFIESTKAIQQAEQVKKLTQLAFCFIPLSFVCGIFGMNVNELANISLWVWGTTSASLLLIVYIVLYFGTIFKFIEHNLRVSTIQHNFHRYILWPLLDIRSFFRWYILWYITRWRPDDWPYDW